MVPDEYLKDERFATIGSVKTLEGRQKGEILEQVVLQDPELNHLESIIDKLYEYLEPVLLPDHPHEVDVEKPKTPETALGQMIQCRTDRISMQAYRLRILADRVNI